jgi:hypothetical protein
MYLLLRKLESFAAPCLIDTIFHLFEANTLHIVLAYAGVDGVTFTLAPGAFELGACGGSG